MQAATLQFPIQPNYVHVQGKRGPFHSILIIIVTLRPPFPRAPLAPADSTRPAEPYHYASLTEKRIAETDRHRLDLRVVIQCRLAQLTTNARLLVAAEGQLPVKRVVRVDPDGACAERVGHLDGRVEVAGVHGGGQAVGGVVADGNHLLLSLKLRDGAHGAEDLLLHNLHVLGHVGEDGWLDEVALVADALAARLDGGAGLLALLDVATSTLVTRIFAW